MLTDFSPRRLTEWDEEVFAACVPEDHVLRRALELIDWAAFRELLAPYYSPNMGRPGEDPVLMLKFEYLRFHYRLSDGDVMRRTATDMAFRHFLRIGVRDPLPHPTSLVYFRGRIGVKGFQKIFDSVVGQAREHRLVKDRLRIKDATHVLADIAIPTTLALVAQVRDRLLAAAEPFDALRAEGERANIELLRQATTGGKLEDRLLARVTHLRELLAWIDELPAPEEADDDAWAKLQQVRQLAHKILFDQENPKAGNRTRSVVDPDARCGKHGDWFDGYLLDVLIDADSEIITQINVFAAGGDEAADAAQLVRDEEAAHGNDIEALSIDGVGFNGRVLRELEDPDGLALDVYVPPKKETATETFQPREFVANDEQTAVTCPAGQTSRYRQRDGNVWIYRFAKSVCQECPLLAQCISKGSKTFGRSVRKNDYEVEYQRARAKAATDAYADVRREHPKVERKLGEIMNRHGGRRARCRGRPKVLMQELMACTATNIKRIARLLNAPKVCAAEA